MSDPAIELIAPSNDSLAATSRQFVTVPFAMVAGLPKLPCDFYVQPVGSSRKILYRSAESDIPISADGEFDQRHFRHLYMRIEDQRLFDQALRDALAVQPGSTAAHLALTANRPYRETDQVNIAMEIMSKETGHFDPELFPMWKEVVYK